ncbi:uroporphyrinogen-III synthase [Arenimonas sp. MALMAid1274]|uniref:uroporphyrinogen-III synthase n=1 Tax=Arenimonas sp. MALMAid1274 TaxID=3411630 RepID=UPI003BA2D3F1
MARPKSPPVLAGWYVISLRPSGSHAPVRRAAATLGARAFPVSTLRLEAVDAGVALSAALACPRVVFTSPAAVRFARLHAPLQAQPGQRWVAVGSGTAAALQRAGVDDVELPPGRSDSEHLLALPALQDVAGLDVGLVTAPGGRGLIAETLAQRGARMHLAEVYRRVPVAPTATRLARLDQFQERGALLVSSAEAFDGLWSRLPEPARARWRLRPVVASSPRLAASLAALGFTAIVLAEGAAPSHLLQALARDVAAGRFR